LVIRYVGGYYGWGNEFDMMKEIKEFGPIVGSFEPDDAFTSYKEGIYTTSKWDNWVFKGEG
jgi:hypothetical protein